MDQNGLDFYPGPVLLPRADGSPLDKSGDSVHLLALSNTIYLVQYQNDKH